MPLIHMTPIQHSVSKHAVERVEWRAGECNLFPYYTVPKHEEQGIFLKYLIAFQ